MVRILVFYVGGLIIFKYFLSNFFPYFILGLHTNKTELKELRAPIHFFASHSAVLLAMLPTRLCIC